MYVCVDVRNAKCVHIHKLCIFCILHALHMHKYAIRQFPLELSPCPKGNSIHAALLCTPTGPNGTSSIPCPQEPPASKALGHRRAGGLGAGGRPVHRLHAVHRGFCTKHRRSDRSRLIRLKLSPNPLRLDGSLGEDELVHTGLKTNGMNAFSLSST